jgi:hypothetical protein
MNIILYVSEYPVQTKEELDKFISRAEADAHEKNILSVIFLKAENGNELGLTVGGCESVLTFESIGSKRSFLASKGISNSDHPLLTVYVNFNHHTEFPQKYVIPYENGIKAAYEFFQTNELPSCIEWTEE